MKCEIVILALILSIKISIAQTFITPVLGLDFLKLADIDSQRSHETNLTILEDGFGSISPLFGMSIKQIIKPNFFISMESDYTYKYVMATNYQGIAEFEGISFDYFTNNLSINYAFDRYYFGIGGSYNFIKNVKYEYHKGSDSFIKKINEGGLQFTSGISINHFWLELYYYLGLTELNDNRDNFNVKPISSFGLKAGYHFKIFDPFKIHSKSKCPTF